MNQELVWMQHTGLGLAVLSALLVLIGAWRLGAWYVAQGHRRDARSLDASAMVICNRYARP